MRRFAALLSVMLAGASIGAAHARTINGTEPGIPDSIAEPPPLPTEFAYTFSMPYGLGDEFPREPAEFDRMLGLLKNAGYNTVHCPYTDWRVPLFEKHGMKMMVDVLAWKPPVEADIRDPAQRPKVKKMCLAVKGLDAIWGYNLWNERLNWCGGFDHLDAWIRMLRTWDPTHPVWVGTYRYLYSEHFKTSPGVHAWYDYHWARGFAWNFKMLNFYRGIAEKRNGSMGKWLLVHDYNRNLYTLNTSIAHGVKTVLWFIGGPYGAREPDKSKRWNEGHHLVRIGRHMQPLYKIIGEMGLPTAVYSTPTRRTADNKDKAEGLPADTTAFPEDHWLRIGQGEVICGFFTLPDRSELVYVANHNAYAWQGVVLNIEQDRKSPRILSEFDRQKGVWNPRAATTIFNSPIGPADAKIFRFERAKAGEEVEIVGEPAVEWNPAEHFARIGKLLGEKGLLTGEKPQPYAVYSTPTSRTPDNKAKERGVPKGATPFPEDFLFTVPQGDFLCGLFKLKDGGVAACLANRNKYAWQGGLLVPRQDPDAPTMLSELHQESGQFTDLGAWADLNFPVAPGGSAVFKLKQKK